jgi:hypothetical protein
MPASAARTQGTRHLIRVEVGAADVPRLASADHVVERAEGLVNRCRRIRMMELIEIDVIGPEPAQRAVDRIENVLAGVTPSVASAGILARERSLSLSWRPRRIGHVGTEEDRAPDGR